MLKLVKTKLTNFAYMTRQTSVGNIEQIFFYSKTDQHALILNFLPPKKKGGRDNSEPTSNQTMLKNC